MRNRRNITELFPGPQDMNRIFPGNPQGIMTERIADLIFERLMMRAQYAIDLHCAAVGGKWEPYTVIPLVSACSSKEVHERAASLARAFGTRYVLDNFSLEGTVTNAALRRGVAATGAEFGVAGYIDEENRQLGVRGVANLLKYLGMCPGSPEVPPEQTLITRLHRLTANHGGFLIMGVRPGERVSQGQVLAEVEDLEGKKVDSVTSPVDGFAVRINTLGVVTTGDLVVNVGTSA
jgi:predicted deacylase